MISFWFIVSCISLVDEQLKSQCRCNGIWTLTVWIIRLFWLYRIQFMLLFLWGVLHFCHFEVNAVRSSSKQFAGMLVSHRMSILLNKHYKFRLYVVMFLLRNQTSWRQCSITISPFILPYYGFGAKYILSFLFYNSNSCPYNVWICAEWDLCWFWVWATNLGLVCRLVNVGNVIWLVIAFL